MVVSVQTRIDTASIRRMASPDGDIDRDMQRRALRVLTRAKVQAPVDTGRMRAAGLAQPATGYPPGTWEVAFPVNYSLWQDQGTRYMSGTFFLTSALPEAL